MSISGLILIKSIVQPTKTCGMPKIDFGKTRKEAYKALNERSIKKNEDIVRNLAPTTFFVSKEHTQKDILVDYLNHTTISFDRLKREKGFIQTSYHWNYVILNANSVVKNMMIAILDNLKANSNIVDVSENQYFVSNNRMYYRAIAQLEKQNIIRLTNKKYILVINHNDVFIGNFTKFCEVYNDTYGDREVVVDGRGRIIL